MGNKNPGAEGPEGEADVTPPQSRPDCPQGARSRRGKYGPRVDQTALKREIRQRFSRLRRQGRTHF
jgi:hypothetical protein